MQNEQKFWSHPKAGNISMFRMGENSDPALAIVFFHGVGYHTEFYGRFLSALCAAIHGLVVFSMDQPGHGESDGERAFIRNWSDHIDACADFVTKCRQSLTKDVPFFLMGDSMGGLISAHLALRLGSSICGAVLVAPALGVRYTAAMRIQSLLGSCIVALAPRARVVNAVREEDISDEPDVLQFWREATGIQRGKLAAATAKANEAGIRYINAKVARFTTPVLVIHGTNDGVTSPSLSEDWLKRTSTDPLLKRFVPVLGAKHMMFEGRHRGTVISCVSDFVRLAMDDGRADIAVSTASIAIEEHR